MACLFRFTIMGLIWFFAASVLHDTGLAEDIVAENVNLLQCDDPNFLIGCRLNSGRLFSSTSDSVTRTVSLDFKCAGTSLAFSIEQRLSSGETLRRERLVFGAGLQSFSFTGQGTLELIDEDPELTRVAFLQPECRMSLKSRNYSLSEFAQRAFEAEIDGLESQLELIGTVLELRSTSSLLLVAVESISFTDIAAFIPTYRARLATLLESSLSEEEKVGIELAQVEFDEITCRIPALSQQNQSCPDLEEPEEESESRTNIQKNLKTILELSDSVQNQALDRFGRTEARLKLELAPIVSQVPAASGLIDRIDQARKKLDIRMNTSGG